MNGGDLLNIGGFSLVSGLSITALRHYDEVGILAPAWVDPSTGYRRYRLDQLRTARTIRELRRALAVGATEVEAPVDAAWKPRSSRVTDPSGNLISLFQGYRPAEDACPPE